MYASADPLVRRPDGYTLVELTIVITVMGILAVSLGPKFFTQSVFSQRGYADELGAALRAAQKVAVASGCPAELTLSASAYVVTQQAASGNSCNTTDTSFSTPVIGPDGTAVADSAPSGVTASPTGIYEFDDQGRLIQGASTITVGARTLTIVAGTGFVQIQ